MKITKRQLRKIIRETAKDLEGYGQINYPPGYPEEDAEPLYGEGDDDYYVATRTPQAVAELKAAGFTSDGRMEDTSRGLGPFEMGMYTPQNQMEIEDSIQAAIEINVALMAAVDALEAGTATDGQQAYWDIILPVQRKWSKRGASDTEGRETTGGWLEDQGYDWGY